MSTADVGSRERGEGSKLAGELGRFLDAKGLGDYGSGTHQHPEHPLNQQSLVTLQILYTMSLKEQELLILEDGVQIYSREMEKAELMIKQKLLQRSMNLTQAKE